MLALSSHYSAAINNHGILYTWGHGTDGKLGHSSVVSETSLDPSHTVSAEA